MKTRAVTKNVARKKTSFAVPAEVTSAEIVIGNRRTGAKDGSRIFSVKSDSLTKHGLVCGVTGSGKTATCFSILKGLWQQKTPFMVLELAKSEYRDLVSSSIFEDQGRIYTPGDESTSSFRINPFEIMKGVRVAAHIEALKDIFNATLDMYAPMPYVLERSLITVYEDRGWDIVQNRNLRLPPGMEPGDPGCATAIHPTMKDLRDIILPMTESFGYSDRIGPDVIAGLTARINGLLAGAKGLIFSCRSLVESQTDMATLVSKPVVLELKDVFTDNEKSFFSSVLMLCLSEYRRSQGLKSNLQHVLLIDDAHRLLKIGGEPKENNTSKAAGNFSNLFSNIFTEMRSYGEGFIISTQSPGRLLETVVSNCNLKIIHRLTTGSDLNAVSGGGYLREVHRNELVTLPSGEAIVYAESMSQPQRIKTPSVLSEADSRKSDDVIRKLMSRASLGPSGNRHLGCDKCQDPNVYNLATLVADDEAFRMTYSRYVVASVKDLNQLVQFRSQIIYEVQRVAGRRTDSDSIIAITWCALCRATERYFENKGREHFWSHDKVHSVQMGWLNFLLPAFSPGNVNRRLEKVDLDKWRQEFVSLQNRDQGPLPTCGPCKAKCQFRTEVSELIRDPKLKVDFNSNINRKDAPASDSAAWFCKLLTERAILQPDVDFSYCPGRSPRSRPAAVNRCADGIARKD